jgi:catalase
MSTEQKKVLFENTARNMNGVPKEIMIRHIKNCLKADKAYGEGVAAALNIPMNDVK